MTIIRNQPIYKDIFTKVLVVFSSCLITMAVADGLAGLPAAPLIGTPYLEPEYNSPPNYEFSYGVQVPIYIIHLLETENLVTKKLKNYQM